MHTNIPELEVMNKSVMNLYIVFWNLLRVGKEAVLSARQMNYSLSTCSLRAACNRKTLLKAVRGNTNTPLKCSL